MTGSATTGRAETESDSLVSLRGVGKAFGGVRALDDVSVEIRRGTVHAFIGENGAGKSTLGKIISGTHAPDSGTMAVDGAEVRFASPRAAIDAGISTIQQEIALVPGRSVLENVFLGRERTRLGFPRTREHRRLYRELVESTGFDIDPDARVGSLRIADQQKVEVLRAIARDSKLIVFDEPTAALTPDETEALLGIVRRLRTQGVAVVFVSHFLDEILAIADDITVLRNGRYVATTTPAAETAASLVTLMLGRSQDSAFPPKPTVPLGEVTLAVDGLSRAGALEDVAFEARRGEIVGIAGLVGSGRSELLRAIFGADTLDAGTITVNGRRLAGSSPHRAVGRGIGMLPESRKDQGLFLRRSVAENTTLSYLPRVSVAGFVAAAREGAAVGGLLDKLNIQPRNPKLDVGLMSGGNQQKVMLAKWLLGEPQVLLIDEPTRGVDVGAKYSIYEALFELAERGLTLVVVSSEVEEILGLADRVLVMRRGRLVFDGPRAGLDDDLIMQHAFGAHDPAGALDRTDRTS